MEKVKIFQLKEKLYEESDFDFLFTEADNEVIVLDFDGLKTVDSSGLRNWLVSLDETDIKIVYRNCPIILVSQFVMIPELIREFIHVESFWMPFLCFDCDEDGKLFVECAKSIPDIKTFDPEQISPPLCSKCGDKMEVDDEEIESFEFINRMGQNPV